MRDGPHDLEPSPGGRRRVRIEVSGFVQGVFFRVSCAERARGLGVGGWVRNAGDGVEAEVEGTPDAVEAMIAWCRHGPSGARVTDVRVTSLDVAGDEGFRIRD
jgi:acylphosphatase